MEFVFDVFEDDEITAGRFVAKGCQTSETKSKTVLFYATSGGTENMTQSAKYTLLLKQFREQCVELAR